jgi:hypothetical protein
VRHWCVFNVSKIYVPNAIRHCTWSHAWSVVASVCFLLQWKRKRIINNEHPVSWSVSQEDRLLITWPIRFFMYDGVVSSRLKIIVIAPAILLKKEVQNRTNW